MKYLLPVLSLGLGCAAASGQILFINSYFQNFDTLPTSTTNVRANNALAPAWTNNTTLPGWYAAGVDFVSSIAIHNGSDGTPVGQNGSAPASLGSFGSTDRALSPMKQNRDSFIGLRLVNDSGSTLPEVTISFTGEQWRQNADASGTLFFAYQIGATNLTGGTWTAVSQLDFTSPKVGAGAALDGNLPENQVFLTHTITGIDWQPGEELWLRWANITANNGIYLGIDNLTVIPEPSTYALIGGFVALGVVMLRRRRKA